LFPADATSFEDLIEFIYKREVPSGSSKCPKALLRLLQTADRFQTLACVRSCICLLSAIPITLDWALTCLLLPESIKRNPDAKALIKRVCDFTNLEADEYLATDKFGALSIGAMLRLF
jgi:hypothetical protein